MRTRGRTGLIGLLTGIGVLLALPGGSPALDVGKTVNDTVSNVGRALGGGGSSAPQAGNPTPQAGFPPAYVPPMHGTNPHGQGTGIVGDLAPAPNNPLTGDPAGGAPPDGEEVVVGRSRGEQNCTPGEDPNDPNNTCTYHGHVTAVALLGAELIGVDTNEGETVNSPVNPINEMILGAICTGSGGPLSPTALCLSLLTMDSSTDATGSTNHFNVATANVGGPGGINAGAVDTNGNIEEETTSTPNPPDANGDVTTTTTTCQRSHGDSSVAVASIGGPTGLTADALTSSSDASTCPGDPPQENASESSALQANGMDVGCNDAPAGDTTNINQAFLMGSFPFNPLLSLVCNADDSSNQTGNQAPDPFGVREALSVFVIDIGGGPFLKSTTAASESQSQEFSETTECTSPGPGRIIDNGVCRAQTCEDDPTLPECQDPCVLDPTLPECTDPCLADPEACEPNGRENCDSDDPETVERCLDDGGAGGQARAGAGTLPFTGTNVLLIALMGVGLLGGGLALKASLNGRSRT